MASKFTPHVTHLLLFFTLSTTPYNKHTTPQETLLKEMAHLCIHHLATCATSLDRV